MSPESGLLGRDYRSRVKLPFANRDGSARRRDGANFYDSWLNRSLARFFVDFSVSKNTRLTTNFIM